MLYEEQKYKSRTIDGVALDVLIRVYGILNGVALLVLLHTSEILMALLKTLFYKEQRQLLTNYKILLLYL